MQWVARVTRFLGRYENQLDEKGRVSLPAAYRRQVGDDSPFILVQSVQPEAPCLHLYPEEAWATVQTRLREFRRGQDDPDARAFVRWITSNAQEVTPDKQGRILIPSWLQEAASLEGTVLISGALDRVEIWDPAVFARSVGDQAQKFGHLASQIFD